MDDLINKFIKIQQNLSELKIQFSQNNNSYDKIAPMFLDGYNFDSDLKSELINNIEMILLNANRFKQIIDICRNIAYTNDNIITILNNDILPNDQIGIKLKKSHDVLFNYVQTHILSESKAESKAETKSNTKPIVVNINDVLVDIQIDDLLIESKAKSKAEPDTNTDNNHTYLNNELDLDSDKYLRPNQLIAINKMIEQNFLSGVNCQIMGAGKSLIILKIIQTHHELKTLQVKSNSNSISNSNSTPKSNLKPKLYIICTERIDILRKLFLEPVYGSSQIIGYKLNQSNKTSWKENNVIDLDKFEFIEYLTKKNFDSDKLIPKTKPILLVINNAFLKAQNSYKKIKRSHIGLVLVDECHLISGPKNYQMFKWFKYGDQSIKDENIVSKDKKIVLKSTKINTNLICPIIGFSATPLRDTKKSSNQLSDIFSNGIKSSPNNKLNLISNYTLIHGLTDQIVLPFKHIIIENRTDGKLAQTRNVGEELIKNIFTKYILTNDELPYKKGVCWDRFIDNIRGKGDKKGNKSIIREITETVAKNNYQIYEHHSKTESDEGFEQFCAIESDAILLCVNCCKEGSDIKNLDYGLYLDGVKKRSFVVSMQTAGRIMRPDLLGKKTYAYIIEVLHSSTDADGENTLSIEALTVNKLLNYYKSILNLSTDDNLTESETDQSYDEISNEFLELYKSTYIIESKNEINIQIGENVQPCVIKFDMKTIDWSKFKEFLDMKVNKICGIKSDINTNKQSNIYMMIYMIYIGANSLGNYYRMVKNTDEPIWGFRNGPVLNSIVKKYFNNKNNKIICFYDPIKENLNFYSSYKYVYSSRLSTKYWHVDSFPHTIFLNYITKINIKFNDLKLSQNWSIKFIPRGLIMIDLMKIKNHKYSHNEQSSHYETYAQTLQQEIDHIMETIKNMCSNSANPTKTDTNSTDKLSDKFAKQILNDLGLEDIPDIEQLLSETNAELESGYELLNRLNKSDFANIETETETETDFETELNFDPEEDILAKVSKAKTSNKKSKQMYTNI